MKTIFFDAILNFYFENFTIQKWVCQANDFKSLDLAVELDGTDVV